MIVCQKLIVSLGCSPLLCYAIPWLLWSRREGMAGKGMARDSGTAGVVDPVGDAGSVDLFAPDRPGLWEDGLTKHCAVRDNLLEGPWVPEPPTLVVRRIANEYTLGHMGKEHWTLILL